MIYFFITEEFDNYMQQDAHEFLNFLINHINEIILGKMKNYYDYSKFIIEIINFYLDLIYSIAQSSFRTSL